MKIEFFENDHGVSFDLVPETPTECAQLLRFVSNRKSVAPEVNFSFSGDNPSASVWLKKKDVKKQTNYLKPQP